MKKLILLFLLITTGLFAQITRAPLWTLSGTTLSPLSSTYGIALGGATLGSNTFASTGTSLFTTGTGRSVTFNDDHGRPNILISNSTTVATIDLIAGGRLAIVQSSAYPIAFATNNKDRFTIDGNGNIIVGSATGGYHKFATGLTSATNLNAFNFVDTDINLNRTSVATATDTSSFNLKYSSLGSPTLSLKGKTGNSLFVVDSVNVNIGSATAVDTQSPDLIITGDADSDGTAFTTEALTVSLTSNATPTLATWAFTSTQSAGYTFDKAVTVTGAITSTSNIATWDSLTVRKETSQLADSLGVITLATGVAGWGEVMAGDNQEWASFRFSSDGAVTLITNTANVTTTVNTVDKLNIYDAGTGVVIQNNLGASKKVAININYFIP